jgi:Helix-turn-helix domain
MDRVEMRHDLGPIFPGNRAGLESDQTARQSRGAGRRDYGVCLVFHSTTTEFWRLINTERVLLMNHETETYSVYEAARELHVSSQWIRTLLAEQRLPGAQKIDGQWKIPASALEGHRQAVSA